MKGSYSINKRTVSGWDQSEKAFEKQLELRIVYKKLVAVVKWLLGQDHGKSKLILIHITDFFWLNAQIGKGLFLSAMVETFHQGRQIGSETHTLMVSPCLPQGMRTVISL